MVNDRVRLNIYIYIYIYCIGPCKCVVWLYALIKTKKGRNPSPLQQMQPPSLWFRQSQSRFERKELYCTEKKLRKSDKSFDFILYICIYIDQSLTNALETLCYSKLKLRQLGMVKQQGKPNIYIYIFEKINVKLIIFV